MNDGIAALDLMADLAAAAVGAEPRTKRERLPVRGGDRLTWIDDVGCPLRVCRAGTVVSELAFGVVKAHRRTAGKGDVLRDLVGRRRQGSAGWLDKREGQTRPNDGHRLRRGGDPQPRGGENEMSHW